ncbi:MAG: hypothetical protein IPG87_17970 [Saprospiraceae bacterium]|nr:hypothetical protein [Candidatus Vicinibacter affinis]
MLFPLWRSRSISVSSKSGLAFSWLTIGKPARSVKNLQKIVYISSLFRKQASESLFYFLEHVNDFTEKEQAVILEYGMHSWLSMFTDQMDQLAN